MCLKRLNNQRGMLGFSPLASGILFIVFGLILLIWYQYPRYFSQKITVGKESFRYIELVKGDAAPTDTLPLLIAVHGNADRADKFAYYLLRDLDIPVRVIIPQAFYKKGTWWPAQDPRTTGIPLGSQRLERFTYAIIEKYKPAGKPVLYGFSQGAEIALYLAVWSPQLFSYVIIESGLLPESFHPQDVPPGIELPMLSVHHGSKDTLYDIDITGRQINNISKLGFPTTFRRWKADHFCLPRKEFYNEIEKGCQVSVMKQKIAELRR